jgi:PAS domain S-box-containing protein
MSNFNANLDSSDDRKSPSNLELASYGTIPEGQSGRALELLQRYVRSNDQQSAAHVSVDADIAAELSRLLDIAVPFFCDWCAVDIVDDDGEHHRTTMRHGECGDSNDDSHRGCGLPTLNARVGDLERIRERVAASGETEVWPAASEELPYCVVATITVNRRQFATIAFVADEGRPGYAVAEIAAAEQIAWLTGVAIEQIQLQESSHDAVRQTQRIASQLHQLIAASITVTGQTSEREILLRLAESTRNVFSANVAYVSLELGMTVPLRAVARKGKRSVLAPLDTEATDLPTLRDLSSPWTDGDWLVAAVVERRKAARGVVAVQRESGTTSGPEDREILTLLAQVASRTLDAAALSRAVQRSEARWRILVESAPVGLVEVDVWGKVRWWNEAAGQLFSWRTFVESNEGTAPLLPGEVLAHLQPLWREALDGSSGASREFLDVEINGRRRDLTASAALLPSAGDDAGGILTLVDDVTDQRELRAELRHAHRMEIRGQVASTVAHDFNNFLTLISGYAEILSQNLESDERSAQMVRDIQSTASRASLLTAQLQTIGRTRAPEPIILDPTSAIESDAEVLERIMGVGVEIVWSLQTDSGNVRIDADQFEQMVLNLALNARDAMANGGVLQISVDSFSVGSGQGADLDLTPGDYVLISVSDNGIGMDDDTRRRCFEPLFTTKDPFKGTGLGLAAARRLVEESGGAIRCLSELGVGTTFEIFLPTIDQPAADETPPIDVARPRGTATVLIAEDDEGLRRLMGQVLRRNGYLVVEANSGERALDAVVEFEGTIDLLLSDVVMDGLGGADLAAQLQDRDPNLRVLLVSGTANSEVLEGLRSRTCAFLAKPFKPSQLVDQVHELLSKRY